MRAATVALTMFAVTCLTGAQCQFLHPSPIRPAAGTGQLEAFEAPRFVAYLNQQAGHLQAVRSDDVSLIASEAGSSLPRLTGGTLACARPRNFRLTAGHVLTSGDEVDVGSNATEFWMFVKRPEPQFVYCSHDDFTRGKANLPVPFEPDWVLQTLGMATFDPEATYTVETDQKDRLYSLAWDAKTPQGEPIRKVIVFAGDRTAGDRPQVLRHVVMDPNRKVIASAEVREVKPVPVAGTPGAVVQVPTRVVLEWPQQKFKMELRLGDVRANEAFTQKQADYFFTRPTISGATAVNLAAPYRPSSYRGASPGGTRPRAFGGEQLR